MMKVINLIIFILSLSSTCYAGKMEEFLKVREELYHLRNSGLAGVPLLSIINSGKRIKEFNRKYKYLQKLITSKDLTKREINRMKQIMRFDKVTEYSTKNKGYGLNGKSFTTPYGIKVSQSCFEILEKTSKMNDVSTYKSQRDRVLSKLTEQVVQKGLEHVDEVLTHQIEKAIDRIIQCGNSYKEVSSYIYKWLNVIKQTEIICEQATSNESGYGGLASKDHVPLFMTKQIILPSDIFVKLFIDSYFDNEGFSTPQNILIHEVFHLASADNRVVSDHGNHKIGDYKDDCNAIDRITDRVYLLSALCSGQKYKVKESGEDYFADQLILKKVKKCGMEMGCVRHFYDGMHTKEEAVKFCKNIIEIGKCRSSYQKNTIMPKATEIIYEKLKRKLFRKLSKCLAYNYYKNKEGYEQVKKPKGCFSNNYIAKSQNQILAKLYKNSTIDVSKYNTFGMFELNFKGLETVKYLYSNPLTSELLPTNEWKILLHYFRKTSFFGVSKTCGEELRIKGTIYKMHKPLQIKPRSCGDTRD